MSFGLEWKKAGRTGFRLSFFCGGLLAAAVPVLDMAFRRDRYLELDASPVQIVMNADWQMMAMLNILLAAAGACILYHTEYADGAIERMRTLPVKESRLFFGKLALMAAMCAVALLIEAAGAAFCIYRWFPLPEDVWMELVKSFGYELLLTLPAALGALFIASACRNMWMPLGINVVCVFTATILPARSFVLSLFPFAMPFQIFAGTAEGLVWKFVIAAAGEILILSIAELILLKVRRSFA